MVAPGNGSEGRRAPYLALHAVNIYVRDQDESLKFYVDRLGFRLAFDAVLPPGNRWVAVSPPDGTAVLSLIAPKPGSKEYGLIGSSTGTVFVTEDVIAKFEEWRRRGVRFLFTPRLRRVRIGRQSPAESQPVWGGIFTRFTDLDGNAFSLVGFDEVNREIDAQRRQEAERAQAEQRAAQELKIAKEVQARLFPQNSPSVETLDYAGVCIQARQVGGDYYDFLDLGHGRFGFVIADIAGKGIAAALLMANLQANLRSQSAIALDEPERLLRSVNRLLHENTSESDYATLFFAEYNDRRRILRYANCGHLPGLLLRADCSVEKLESTCTVVGLFREWDCSIAEQEIRPGDTLVLYTDGVTESFDDAGNEFGEERLVDAMHRNRAHSAPDTVASLVREVSRFSREEQHDDITLIVAKCREKVE